MSNKCHNANVTVRVQVANLAIGKFRIDDVRALRHALIPTFAPQAELPWAACPSTRRLL